jgi:hypothetical protein
MTKIMLRRYAMTLRPLTLRPLIWHIVAQRLQIHCHVVRGFVALLLFVMTDPAIGFLSQSDFSSKFDM